MKHKKRALLLVTILSLTVYFLSQKENESVSLTENKKTKTVNKKVKTIQKEAVSKKRDIASINKQGSKLNHKEDKNKENRDDKERRINTLALSKKLEKRIKDRNRVLKINNLKMVRKIHHKKQSVVIIKTKNNGVEGSFKALIDDKNGKILQTWAQKRVENFFGREHGKLTHPIYK
ncbi:MAG: hypothetical protein VX341_11690 [Bdellovibrionota bacterium]|nr:hypothetical protein [Bdellovibrionota bacterium]